MALLSKLKMMIFDEFVHFDKAKHTTYIAALDDYGNPIESRIMDFFRKHDIVNFSISRFHNVVDVTFSDENGKRIHYQLFIKR